MSSEYISSNPNIRLSVLKKATEKFEGYIAGLGGNNSLYLFTADKELKAALKPGEDHLNKQKEDESKKEERELAKILNTILDTSSGAYLTKEYLSNPNIYGNPAILAKAKDQDSSFCRLLGSSFKVLSQFEFFEGIPAEQQIMKLITDTGSAKGVALSSVTSLKAKEDLTFTPPDPNYGNDELLTEEEKKEKKNLLKLKSIKAKYPWLTFKELKEKDQNAIAEDAEIKLSKIKAYLKKEYEKEKVKEKSLNDIREKFKQKAAKEGALRKENIGRANIENFVQEYENGESVNIPLKNTTAGLAGNKNLSMNAFVFCNQNVQRSTTNQDALNVFFNGIPPIEMSRCTPFLDITIYHKNSSKNNKKFLNQEFHMRFLKQKNGNFVLADDSLSNAKRLNAAKRESSLDSSFMDVFTSPQTMANANINKSASIFSKEEKNTGDHGFLEPIVPLMSLNSFQVSISGMGFGMVSSRKGSMSLILHDRSRLTDFAPLVSLNQLVSTSIRVEFGWSHPDGDPIKSKNEIGKFLNCFRDVQFYNLTGTNLSFNNNSVNIEVQLASAGFDLMTDASAATGYYVALNLINDKINKLIDDIISEESLLNADGEKEKQEGILKKLKIIRSAITSQTAVVKTEDYKKVLSLFESKSISNVTKLSNIVNLLNFQSAATSKELESISDIETLIDNITDEGYSNQTKEQSRLTAKLIKDKLAVAEITEDFDFSETTRTAFQQKFDNANLSGGNLVDEQFALEDLGLRYEQTITFGKLVLMYCALPMTATCEFEDVQVFFYPINNRAGGARRFTTASLPIEYSVVRNAIDERFKNAGNISVKGMFALLANLFDDSSRPVYGIGTFDFDKEKEKLSSQDKNKLKKEKEAAIAEYKEKHKKKPTPEEEAKGAKQKELTDEQKEQIFKMYLSKKFREKTSEKLETIYNNDGLPMASADSLVAPSLQMHMEVLPVIDPTVSTKGASAIDDFLFGAIKTNQKDGYMDDKKILRIHVYDSRTNGNNTGELLNSILNEEVSDYLVGQETKELASQNITIEKDKETKGSRLISKIPTKELKYFVKRFYPNVTYGATSSVIKNLTFSSNTNDKVSQLVMIRRKADERSSGASKNRVTAEEEVSINPTTPSLEIFGCPFINRGTQIFLDTGTGTDLDNVYTVNSITHTVRSGEYVTSLGLALTAQGAISSTRRKLSKKLKIAAKEIKKNK